MVAWQERRTLRRATCVATALGTIVALVQGIDPAAANPAPPNPVTVTISGGANTAVVGSTLFAKAGATLTVSVTAPSTTECVDLTYVAFGQTGSTNIGHGQSASGKSSWSFPVTASAGDGALTITATATDDYNKNNVCNTSPSTGTASYTADNTGPVLTPVLTPAANTSGWNKTDTTVTWTASDSGSGIASQPTTQTLYQQNGVFPLNAPASFTDRVGNPATGSGTLRLDEAAPTITATRTPAANGFGWNNTPVSVTFNCQDNPVLPAISSGLAQPGCPSGSTVSTNGANQSVSGSVSDVAGNTASTTVNGISVDQVKPTLSGAPTTNPISAGWYNGDVTIRWTAADALSGLDPSTIPADSTITGEGQGQTVSQSVADRAGNITTATSPAVNIDRTPPTTAISGTSNAWTNSDVTVTLTATDPESGVASTSYAIDGGATQTGTSFTLSAEGDHTVTFWSTDKVGNTEAAHTAHVKIDKTAPTISHRFDLESYSDNAWTNANSVTVTFACSDTGSGVASCTAPVAVTSEGAGQQVRGTATDNAGNTATDTATVNIDRTPPTIGAALDRAANGNGWYRNDVTVSFLCADQPTLSGIKSCPAGKTLTEGKNQTASGTAVDNAGNTASATVSGINIDETAPSIAGAATTQPNAAGWYDNSVVVKWTCGDALSGLDGACPANSTISGEGSSLSTSASVSDQAGNTGSATVGGIKIDLTPPVTTASVNDPLTTGWYATKAHVTLSAGDNLSGIASTWYQVDNGSVQRYTDAFDITTSGQHTVSFWSVDNAGNVEDVTGPGHSLTVKIDNIPPSITGSASPTRNAAGWNNSPVTVHFACSDAESGIASCTPDTLLSTDGASQSVTGTAVDNGGNSNSATVSGIKIDSTAPTVSGTPTAPPNDLGWYNGDVTVKWAATDATSGVDGSTLPADTVVTGEGDNLTAGPVSVSDLAGNTGTASVPNLKIDRTAPVITGKPTTDPNAAGWYSGDVAVQWACSDALSGIAAGTCPADSTITGEGDSLSATASVSDRAGNPASNSVSVKIDRTPPTTAISAPSGWINTDATVTLSPSDNLSGVATTWYTVNGGPAQIGTSIPFSAEGVYNVEAWSVDVAGNVETPKDATIRIDKTAPTISHTLSPAPNLAGWNNTDVQITFSCNDTGGSGIASCTSPITETHEGQNQPESGTAIDNAGNTTTDPATVSIDKTPPTISGSPDRSANGQGWYKNDVTVGFSCADQVGLSGVQSCSSPKTLGEGKNQSVSGTAIDAAGNTASTTVSGINVDETAPTLAGAATTSPNSAQWYRGDVTVHWTCADTLSGIAGACPADSVVTGEGTDLGASAQVSDVAGNATTATVSGIQIDRTAPTTSASVPLPDSANGWYAHGPQVTLTAADGLSGVAATYYQVDGGPTQTYTGAFIEGLEGVHTVTFWSVDNAGNTEDSSGANNTLTIRVDTTKPTIIGSRTPAANAGGWNNTPVTVSFQCDDTESGVASCPSQSILTADGRGQSVAGTATDKVGNTMSTSVGDINIDQTPPTLTGAATTAPNSAGWYSGDVTVRWACSDDLSGLAAACPADSVITGEGSDLHASTTISDNAGNPATATVNGINIDRTAPKTTATAPSGWVNGKVDVQLSATDNLSGVAQTYYTVNGGTQQAGTDIPLTSDGIYTLTFWSVDKAGNVGQPGTATVKIDQTAPTITHTIRPAPNAGGWNNTSATVTFQCSDNLSGIASCTGGTDGVPVTSEGAAQKVTGTAVDNAGNSQNDTATVSIDLTKPTIGYTLSGKPNANGWYNTDVTVSFTCNDALSGMASCADPHTLTEGAGQTVTGTATDAAGNSQSVTTTAIDIDKTAPTLTGQVTSKPNANGWYSGDVTVHWTCSDALSGLAGSCPADSVVSGDGADLSATASISDNAGNLTTTTVGGLHIDHVAPTTTATAPDPGYSSGWYAAPVPVTLHALDNLSGVAATYYAIDGGTPVLYKDTFTVGGGVHTIAYWSTDLAGNVEASTANTLTLKVDNRPPSISGAATTSANTNGWYNGPVTVHFTCSDAETAIAAAGCPADRTISAEGANQFVTGTATDAAGNTATATIGPISIDTTAPVFAPYTAPTAFTVGQTVTAPACRATDALSGIASCQVTSKTGSGFTNANGVGDFVYTLTAADKAGNTSTQTVTFHVGYQWSGFLQPVTNTAHDLTTASVFNAGSSVPLKFQLKTASGTVVQASYMPVWIQPVDLGTASTAGTAVTGASTPTVGGSFKWDASGQQYVFTWQTPKSGAGHYYRVGVQLDSGDIYQTLIVLK